MTTTDAESDSQDSDDGRRFRFEATRKDVSSFQCRRSDALSDMRGPRSPVRSREGGGRSKRENRSNHISIKERSTHHNEQRNHNDRKSLSRDSSRNNPDRNEATEHKKTFKHSRESEKRDSSCRDTRDLKCRHIRRKRSRDRSRESKNRTKYGKYSRGREPSDEKVKRPDCEKPCRVKPETDDRKKLNELQSRSIQETCGLQDSKDLNLSDFDIISETEGNSDDFDAISESASDEIGKEGHKTKEDDDGTCRQGDESSSACLSNPNDVLHFPLPSTSAKCLSMDDTDTLLRKDSDIGAKKLHAKGKSEKCREISGDVKAKISGSHTSSNFESKSCNASKIIGPCLPDHFKNAEVSLTEKEHVEEDYCFGPALPPHLCKVKEIPVSSVKSNVMESDEVECTEGPRVIGPLPAHCPALKDDLVQQQLEYRAQLLKREMAEIDQNTTKQREEWMTELPTVNSGNLRLEARKFRMRAGPDMSNRSDWTDTPADRAKKKIQKTMSKPTETYEEPVKIPSEASSRKKTKSLLEMHKERQHKKKKKEEKAMKKLGKVPERRPFDRDIDLQINTFNEARKNKVCMNAATLNDRFKSGKI